MTFLLKKLKQKKDRLFIRSNWNLLVEMTRANFMNTDYNSVLGIAWSFINPFILLVTMYIMFKAHFGQTIKAYPLYLLLGIISVNFFINTTVYLGRVFFFNREFILNLTASREILISSKLFIHTFKFVIELFFCLTLSVFYRMFTWKIFLILPPLLFTYIAFTFGVSLILAFIYCLIRDAEHMWFLFSRLLLFVTPIFYILGQTPSFAQKIIYFVNPITPFLICARQIFMDSGKVDPRIYTYSLLLNTAIFISGYVIFIIFENSMAERI